MSSINSYASSLLAVNWEPQGYSSHHPAPGIPYCRRAYAYIHHIILAFWFFFSFLPSSNPLIIFPLESILQLPRDLCSHVACLSLCLLSPVSQSTQGCHGHQDTISMPLVSWPGDGVITHLQYDLKKSFGTGDQGLKTLLHSHWNHYPEELKMEICQEKHHSGGLRNEASDLIVSF